MLSSASSRAGEQPLQGHRAPRATQLRHVLDGRQAVSDNVPHRNVGPALRQRHHVIPVAPEPMLGVRRFVADGQVQFGDLRRFGGQNRRLQHCGAGMLVGIHLRAHQGLPDHGGDRRDVRQLRDIEWLRPRPHHPEHADLPAAGCQRPVRRTPRPLSASSSPHWRDTAGDIPPGCRSPRVAPRAPPRLRRCGRRAGCPRRTCRVQVGGSPPSSPTRAEIRRRSPGQGPPLVTQRR